MDNFGRKITPNRSVQHLGGSPEPQQPQSQPQSVAQPQLGTQSQPVSPPQPVIQSQPLNDGSDILSPKKKSKKRAIALALASFLTVLCLAIVSFVVWFNFNLEPADSTDTSKTVVTIENGSTPQIIAEQLEEKGFIRNSLVFQWHARLYGVQDKLQAGTYRLSKSESTPEIIDHLVKGKVDTFAITFLPGMTVETNKKVFLEAGYSQQEVDEAFAASYDSALFKGRSATADLEGYIYAETYSFGAGASVKGILGYIFDYYYKIIEENGLEAKYEAQGLSLFEGITMASIVEKEAVGGDEAQIAQVFLTRYSIGMALGSDPTYQYIADKEGNPRDINYDSPYNTRRYVGLPPGPIAAPGLAALKAVASPAEGDYLYFLSGDDDITYFSRTFEEHEANIRTHCQVKCLAL